MLKVVCQSQRYFTQTCITLCKSTYLTKISVSEKKIYNCSLPPSYTLNTCVEPPHDQPVTSLTFQLHRHGNQSSNSIPLLVSTSLDGHFKMWVLLQERGGLSWACRAVGYYHGHMCMGTCFSEDGSLLAVNFKTVSESPNVGLCICYCG